MGGCGKFHEMTCDMAAKPSGFFKTWQFGKTPKKMKVFFMEKSSIFTENNYIDTLDTLPKKEVNSADGSWVFAMPHVYQASQDMFEKVLLFRSPNGIKISTLWQHIFAYSLTLFLTAQSVSKIMV